VLRLQDFRGKPLLLNFWATWCPPCIEELPLINAFYVNQKARGWQVIGLAVDRPAAVKGFLQKTPLNFPIALAGTTGGELATKLGNPSGALPFPWRWARRAALYSANWVDCIRAIWTPGLR